MSRNQPDPDYVVLHIHRVEFADGSILKRLEKAMANVSDDIKKMRKALDAIKAAEAKEDSDAAAFADERNAKVAELTAKIAELEARPSLSEADHAELDAFRDELVAMAPVEPPTPISTRRPTSKKFPPERAIRPTEDLAGVPRPEGVRVEDSTCPAGLANPALTPCMARQPSAVRSTGRIADGLLRGTGGDRYQLLVHLDQDVLAADGQWAATLDDGSHVSAETLRRIACDTALVTTRTDGNGVAGVLDVGRRTRSIPSAIRRALWVRGRGCRFPGCPHTRFLHGHHIRHWMHGGPTSLTNLVLLCPRHHTMVHEGGFTIEVGTDGALVFRSPKQTPLPFSPPRADVEDAVLALREWAAERDIEIGPDTNLPWWDGSAVPDYDWAISSLLQ